MAELDPTGRLRLTEEDWEEMQDEAMAEVDRFASDLEAEEEIKRKIYGRGGLWAQKYNQAEAEQG